MIGLTNSYNSNSGLFGFFDCFFHCINGNKLSHSIMAINHCRYRCFKYNFRLCLRMDRSLFDSLMITHHSLHAMTFYSIKVSCKKHILDLIAFFLCKTKRLEYVSAKMIQCLI